MLGVLNSDFYLASSHARTVSYCLYQGQLLEPRVEVFSRLLLLPTSSTFYFHSSTFYFLGESQTGLPLSTLDLTTALALVRLGDSNYLLKPEFYLFPDRIFLSATLQYLHKD